MCSNSKSSKKSPHGCGIQLLGLLVGPLLGVPVFVFWGALEGLLLGIGATLVLVIGGQAYAARRKKLEKGVD